MIYTCIECENLYDDTDGDLDERMCNRCIDQIYEEKAASRKKIEVESFMNKFDQFIKWIKGERRDPDIRRSSTVHYPDWNMKKKEYIIPPRQRKEDNNGRK